MKEYDNYPKLDKKKLWRDFAGGFGKVFGVTFGIVIAVAVLSFVVSAFIGMSQLWTQQQAFDAACIKSGNQVVTVGQGQNSALYCAKLEIVDRRP